MAIVAIEQLEIEAYSEQALRTVALPVDTENRVEALDIVQDLLDTMLSQTICVGLAANQIGSHFAIAVLRMPESDDPMVLINPSVTATSGKKDLKRESCMSIWGQTGEVERRYKVSIDYQDLELQYHEAHFSGFTGRVVQHEIDHLNGVLYIDHVVAGQMRPTDIFDGFSPKPADSNL